MDATQNRVSKKTEQFRFFLVLFLNTQIVSSLIKTIILKIYRLNKKLLTLKVEISKIVPSLSDFALIENEKKPYV